MQLEPSVVEYISDVSFKMQVIFETGLLGRIKALMCNIVLILKQSVFTNIIRISGKDTLGFFKNKSVIFRVKAGIIH